MTGAQARAHDAGMEATTKLQRAGRAPATPVNEDHSHEAERYHRRSPGLRHSDSWTTDPRTAPIVLAIVREAECDDPILSSSTEAEPANSSSGRIIYSPDGNEWR